jgi:glycosyltransferase involved in cell wall biosynthesis
VPPETHPFSKVAFIGDYVPRRCGIATFTADICESLAREHPAIEFFAAAINDTPDGYPYPDRVRFEVGQNDKDGYRQLAEFLNMSQVDLVCVQHEYGIYGGTAGSYLLTALRRLRMPIVTTLHTVLAEPNHDQNLVLKELCELSERLIVMSEKAGAFLTSVYACAEQKIDLIHHGIPDMPFVDPNFYKDMFKVEGRRVILTFGLLSPNKGIEYMIDALPAIVQRIPDVVYIVLGATHPHIKREQGEEYRLGLQLRARKLGVARNVVFHNRYVTLEELCQFLGAADLYVTPYLNAAQIVSGTLAYSLGNGKAVISTPYWYADEVLADGRGRIVPFRDSAALAATAIELFENEGERHAMRKRAYSFGRKMIWTEVAKLYIRSFRRAAEERLGTPVAAGRQAASDPLDFELPELNLNHLLTMTDDTGILQHACRTTPNFFEGYTTDDNARALIVALRGQRLAENGELLRRLAAKYLAFVNFAFNPANGRFRNFLGYDRHWLEDTGSEDSHGRALRSLGYAANVSVDEGLVALAMNLFESGLKAVEDFTSPRAWAFALLGICAHIRRFPGGSNARRFREMLATRLYDQYRAGRTDDWPWFEQSLAYANARLSESLILAGNDLGNQEMVAAGIESLEWLYRVQMADQGHFVPIANPGWHRGEPRPRFDQQPIEAQGMLEACSRAYRVTGERRWRERMGVVFDWFLGRNDLGRAVYDYSTGGCHDGLHHEGVNANEGAESTLAFLSSLLELRNMEPVVGVEQEDE